MANTDPLPMHPDFARWHDSIALGDDQTRREARWAGVTALVEGAETKDVEALIRLAFKSRQSAASAQLDKIRQAFRAGDAAFQMEGNQRELQVMAAASLAALMEQGNDIGAEAALAVTTALLDGARKPDLPMDLSVLAEGAINQVAETNRKRPNLAENSPADVPKADFGNAVAKAKAEPNAEGFAQAFALAAEAVNAAFAQMARQMRAQSSLIRILQVQDEELQMLWWLTGRRSFDLDCTFDSVPVDAQPLLFAKELADSTELLPGPPSVKGLLSHAGLKDRKKIALSRAINTADAEWASALSRIYPPVLTRIDPPRRLI